MGSVGKMINAWPDELKQEQAQCLIKTYLQEAGYGVWSGSSWLRIGTGGGHL